MANLSKFTTNIPSMNNLPIPESNVNFYDSCTLDLTVLRGWQSYYTTTDLLRCHSDQERII